MALMIEQDLARKRLKEFRKRIGLTQKQMAAEMGMSSDNLSMIERGERKFLPKHINVLCSHMGMDRDWFMTGEGKPLHDENKDLVDKFTELPEDKQEAIMRILDIMAPQEKQMLQDGKTIPVDKVVDYINTMRAEVSEEIESCSKGLEELVEKEQKVFDALADATPANVKALAEKFDRYRAIRSTMELALERKNGRLEALEEMLKVFGQRD